MNVNQIEHFLDVARTCSLNKSAGNLFISPQGLSSSISRLESECGLKLFVRTNHGMTLTEEGKHFLVLARGFREDCLRFERAVTQLALEESDQAEGMVNLTMPPVLAIADTLPAVMGLLSDSLPGVRFSVTEMNSLDLIAFAESLSFDELSRTVMLASVPEYRASSYLADKRFRLTPILEFPMVVRVSADHPFATRDSVSRAEIAAQRLLCFNEPVIEEIMHHLLDEYGELDIAFKGSVRDLTGRFPDAVTIVGGFSPRREALGSVDVPIRGTVSVHVVAVTGSSPSPIIRRCVDCIVDVARRFLSV